jgi:PRTRC genetic system protein B
MTIRPDESQNALELATRGLGDITQEEPRQKLQMRISLYDETIILTRYDDGAPISTYEIAPDDLASAFSDVPLATDLLPPQCLHYSRSGGQEALVVYLPTQTRSLTYKTAQGQSETMTIPTPDLVFAGRGSRYRIFAVKQRPHPGNDRERLFAAPFPNVHSDGRICAGNVTFPVCSAQTIHQAARRFFNSQFNGDLSNDKSSRFENVIALWRYLQDQDIYPNDDLVRTRYTFDDLTQEK